MGAGRKQKVEGKRDLKRGKGAEGEKGSLKQLSLKAALCKSSTVFLGLVFASRRTRRTHQDCDSSLEVIVELQGHTDLTGLCYSLAV